MDEQDYSLKSLAQDDLDSAPRRIERRRSARTQTDDVACLHILNPASPERFDVQVCDVSKGGFKLKVARFLYPGCTVQIRLKDVITQGNVRYCVPAKNGFYVGVRTEDVGQEVLDRATALASAGGDLEILAGIVALFFEQYPSLVSSISGAIASGDAKAVRDHAHKLKGSVGCFAAKDALAATSTLEEMGLKNDLTTADEACQRLRQALAHLHDALDELCEETTPQKRSIKRGSAPPSR